MHNYVTYNDMTSEGKLRGINPALSHNALSLVHIHDEGQRGCLALLLSTTSKIKASKSKTVNLEILFAYSILANRYGHDLCVE